MADEAAVSEIQLDEISLVPVDAVTHEQQQEIIVLRYDSHEEWLDQSTGHTNIIVKEVEQANSNEELGNNDQTLATDTKLITTTQAAEPSKKNLHAVCSQKSGKSNSRKSGDQGEEKHCRLCDDTVTTFSKLREHYTAKHPGREPFGCSVCSKEFAQRRHLQDHMAIHSNRRDFVCDKCGLSFKVESIFRRHVNRCLDIRNYVCNVCQKAFVSSDVLKRHFQCHTGEKPFKCSNCSKAFTTKYNLQVHNRIHTMEKPFVCLVCGRGFGTRQALSLHANLHYRQPKPKSVLRGSAAVQHSAAVVYVQTEDFTNLYGKAESDRSRDSSSLDNLA